MNNGSGQVKPKKLGKALRMLKWISVAPGITVEILGTVLDLSERGVYRYMKELKRAGVPIVNGNRDGGYSLLRGDLIRDVNLVPGVPLLRRGGPTSLLLIATNLLDQCEAEGSDWQCWTANLEIADTCLHLAAAQGADTQLQQERYEKVRGNEPVR